MATNDPFRRVEADLRCEQVPVRELADRFGTPLYVYSRRAFLDRVSLLDEAFEATPHLVCFSVKACSNLALLTLLHESGAGADVVSGGELFRALTASVPPSRIVFAGVGKSADEIRMALDASILSINCESEAELDTIERVAAQAGHVAPVSIRVNPGVLAGGHGYIETGHDGTKFGVSLDDALRLYHRLRTSAHLRAVGVCAHIGSQIMEPEPYVHSVRALRTAIESLAADGVELDFVDIGGGFGITYSDESPEPIGSFAAAVTRELRGLGLRVLLEPGRFIAGNSGILLTRVVHTKQSESKSFVVVDAAMNDLIRPSLYGARHRIEPVSAARRGSRVVDVVGPICETGDFLGREIELAEVEAGDLLAVRGAGAYAASMASNYNSRPRAAEVLVDGARVKLVRRRETYADLIRTEMCG